MDWLRRGKAFDNTDELEYSGELHSNTTVPLLAPVPPGGVVALRVDGNSVSGDGICHGDILYIDPDQEFMPTRSGNIGVLKCNGGYKIRRVKDANDGKHYNLVPSNPEYEPETIPIDGTCVFKIVLWIPGQEGLF